MRYIYYWKIFFYSLKKNWKQALIASFGISIALFFYLSIFSVTEGFSKLIRSRLIGDMPINTIHVYKKYMGQKFSFSQLLKPKIKNGINLKEIKKIKKIKGIKRISYVQTLQKKLSFYFKFPKLASTKVDDTLDSLSGLFTGEEKNTSVQQSSTGIIFDGVVSGISTDLARPGLKIMKNFKPWANGTIPLMLPIGFRDIAAIYLNTHGGASSLIPDFNKKVFPKIELDLFLDYSVAFKSGTKDKKYKLRLAGIMPNNEVPAFLLPLSLVRKWNKEVSFEAANLYSDLFVEVENSGLLESVVGKIKKTGLLVKSDSKVARKADRTIKLVQMFFQGITFVFLLLAAIAIVNAFLLIVSRMQKEIALFRFLGASKIYIASLIIIEAVFIGLLHGILAWYGAMYFVEYLNANILNWIPFLPIKEGEILFQIPKQMFFQVLSISALSAAIASFIPAMLASRQSILETLRK